MAELDNVTRTPAPATVETIVADLRASGVESGSTLLVHSSLSSLGWVCGGPVALVAALKQAVTDAGTLVMPTFTADLSDPAIWEAPPVPASWHDTIRQHMPAFDRAISPTRGLGAVVECFRSGTDVVRSDHPQSSFAAWGKHRDFVVQDHGLEIALGERSPLARIYELEGHVLLLGVGHERNTSLHLAECRTPQLLENPMRQGAPMLRDGRREWVEFEDVDYDSDDFATIGAAFESDSGEPDVRLGKVALAQCRLVNQRSLVDFGVRWIAANRFGSRPS